MPHVLHVGEFIHLSPKGAHHPGYSHTNVLPGRTHNGFNCGFRRAVVQKLDGSGETAFSFDRVYGGKGAPFEELYTASVAPLVDGLFEGFSATAFAYGALRV